MTTKNLFLKHPKVGTPSPLKVADLERLHEGNRNVGAIKRIRASHHKIARLSAKGLNNKEIAAYTGYTRERVGQLLAAPAMVELVAQYREKDEERENELNDAYLELKYQNMIAAERHTADRIEQMDAEGELMTFRESLAVSADAADRLGYAKRTNVNVNHSFAGEMERAIRRSGKVIDAVPNQVAGIQPPRLSSSHRTDQAPASPPRLTIARRA